MPDKSVGLTLDIEHTGSTVIVRCHGRLTSDVDDVLYARVKQLLPDSKRIVLDLSDLTRMDSMGLGTLVRLYVSARSAGCSLELMNLGKQIRLLLGTAHLLSAFSIVGEHGIKLN
jgi:anti-sigma B factor antagonist